jgi:CheY-like chemotaxis protein
MNKQKKILFIDDEEITSKIGELMLKDLGHDVTTTQSGQEGLKLLKIHDFDLLFLDLMMPEIYGLDILKKIRKDKKLKKLRVIIQTGVMNKEELEEAYRMGVIAIITKPYNKDFLKKILEENIW